MLPGNGGLGWWTPPSPAQVRGENGAGLRILALHFLDQRLDLGDERDPAGIVGQRRPAPLAVVQTRIGPNVDDLVQPADLGEEVPDEMAQMLRPDRDPLLLDQPKIFRQGAGPEAVGQRIS